MRQFEFDVLWAFFLLDSSNQQRIVIFMISKMSWNRPLTQVVSIKVKIGLVFCKLANLLKRHKLTGANLCRAASAADLSLYV